MKLKNKRRVEMTHSLTGTWMGSLYGPDGRRWDYYLHLDHTMRYERIIRIDGEREEIDRGRWEYREEEEVLHLLPDTFNDNRRLVNHWRVLAVHTCETSNSLLVLRAAIIASRNLPILFYRVHDLVGTYGTDWIHRLKNYSTRQCD